MVHMPHVVTAYLCLQIYAVFCSKDTVPCQIHVGFGRHSGVTPEHVCACKRDFMYLVLTLICEGGSGGCLNLIY